jgi:tRNA threonylcarbamoyladenosine biosynthesis protein TsaE
MTEYISHNLEETKAIAQKVLETNARVIALQGNLGAGKTAITKCIAELLGITEAVTSPTFVIMKKYHFSSLEGGAEALRGGGCLIHIDAYRIQTENELDLLNLNDLIKDEKNLIIIEWPEQTMKLLPPETLIVQCEFINEMTRKYSF